MLPYESKTKIVQIVYLDSCKICQTDTNQPCARYSYCDRRNNNYKYKHTETTLIR